MTPYYIPTQKSAFITEQMTMLSGYVWWSGQGFENLMWLLTTAENLINYFV